MFMNNQGELTKVLMGTAESDEKDCHEGEKDCHEGFTT